MIAAIHPRILEVIDANERQKDLNVFLSSLLSITDEKAIYAKLLAEIPKLQNDLETENRGFVIPAPPVNQPVSKDPFAVSEAAIEKGEQKYANIQVPILAIFASPHSPLPQWPDPEKAAFVAYDQAKSTAQANLFEKLKSAKVVIIPNANHFIFLANEQEVEKDIEEFLSSLKLK